jgi:nucleoside-diphosphate-sugar epimerase
MKKKVLILGSAGQIGSYLFKYLKRKQYIPIKFDIQRSKSEDLRVKNNIKLIKLVKKVDFVFFLAFDVGGAKYLKEFQDTNQFISNNLLIMENTFQILKKFNVNFIFTSSQMSNMQFSNYGLLKKVGEQYAKSINGLCVKLWNVYGIEKKNLKSHVITDFITQGFVSKSVKLLTNGTEKRNFLHVEDCCDALIFLMERYNFFVPKQVIDISSDFSVSINKLSLIIKKLFLQINKKVTFIPGKKIDVVQNYSGNSPSNFLQKYWKPKFTLESGIKKIFDYHKFFFIKSR